MLAGTASAACPTPTGSNTPPGLPAGVPDRDLETVLLVTPDGCGNPGNVAVEWSSGFAVYDQAAVDRIRTWHFDAHEGVVRVPVRHEGAAGEPTMPEPPKGYRYTVEALCRTRVDPVPAASDGTVPGFIPDPLPIGYASVEEAAVMLQREGRRNREAKLPNDDAREYQLGNVLEPSEWIVFKGGFVFAPSVVRFRRVHDGTGIFWMTSGLCEAKDPAACAKFEQYMRGVHDQPQRYGKGYPPLPAGTTCPAGTESPGKH